MSRPQLIHSLLVPFLAALLVACGDPGATATPTAGGTPSPSVSPSPSLGRDQIEHPTGATDVVLRMEQGGGLVPMGFMVTQMPQFTLYGDGTVIFKQLDTRNSMPMGGQALLPLLTGRLDEAGVQALLTFALGTGRLANARDRYDDPTIADAGTTVFTLNALGLSKTVSIYALMEQPWPGPEAVDRQGFSRLADVLNSFQQQNGLGEVKPYDPPSYRVVLLGNSGQATAPPLAWPWTDLTLADFHETADGGLTQAVLDRDHVEKLLAVPNGGNYGIWVTAPDGSVAEFGVRPFLPDELPTA